MINSISLFIKIKKQISSFLVLNQFLNLANLDFLYFFCQVKIKILTSSLKFDTIPKRRKMETEGMQDDKIILDGLLKDYKKTKVSNNQPKMHLVTVSLDPVSDVKGNIKKLQNEINTLKQDNTELQQQVLILKRNQFYLLNEMRTIKNQLQTLQSVNTQTRVLYK